MVLQWEHLNQRLLLLLFSDSVVSNFCNPMACSTPGSSVLHHLPEFAQSFLRVFPLSWWCHLTISSTAPHPSLHVLNLSQHRDLFQWVNSLHQVAKALELQQQSFQRIFRVDFFMEYYSKVRKKKELLIQTTTWRSLKKIRLSVKSQFQKNTYFWSIQKPLIWYLWSDMIIHMEI